MKRGGHVYIMTNKRYGVLYIGVTADLAARVAQHREGTGGAFTSKYKCNCLVYVEEFATIDEAIAREKAMKAWKREWKIEAIEKQNPSWDDLYLKLLS
ncbi:excinuclease ABC subunit C [Erythrobacter sp. Dej080120_24]|uniref:GIY-YIG nuclease family protein n=1 Tax=Erythrobacter sp. Dej080120_24 TaxID=3024837 RepID=UPI00292341A4|nr:excinuclease ABC subunit C [Erythrobacter sp. Dej080120_24]